MGLKARFLSFMLLLMIIFLGVVSGEETHRAPEATYYTPITYYGDTSHSGVSGSVIIFERKNEQGVLGDVGHVGIAIQLNDGTWIAGAIEGPGGIWGAIGTLGSNGGWYHSFATKEDVIKEFAEDRSSELYSSEGNISSHAAYDKMKTIEVGEIDAEKAKEAYDKMKDFPKDGFGVLGNNDCFTRAYEVMELYGVDKDTLGNMGYLTKPKEYFDKLPGEPKSLDQWMSQEPTAATVDAVIVRNPQSAAILEKTNPTDTSQSTTSESASADTSQRLPQNVLETAQYGEPSTGQGSSSTDSFDAYSEGKRLAAEAFAAKYQSTQPSSEIAQGLEPITQTIAASSSESTAKNFKKGDRIETTDLLNVRSEPGLPEDGSQDTRISAPKSKGNTGTILNDQPVYADGFAWWKIQYDDGTIGWSQDKRLESQSIQETPQETNHVEPQEASKTESTQRNDISFGSVHETAQQTENKGASFGSEEMSFGASSSSSNDQLQKFGSSSEESYLAGINFTSIKLNSISITTDSSGGINFDLILKAERAEGSKPGINIQNASRIGAAAFMTGLAVNDYKFWVNLNPWEVDRIIDEELGQSEVGRIMLEADLQMKRDFSNYGNPCANETGKALWNLLDKKREDLVQRCMNRFPGEIIEASNIIFKPVQRHWIVPDKAYAYSNGSLIYIINASLAINSEPVTDHSSFQVKNQDINNLSRDCIEELNRSAQEYAEYYNNLEERMIQPYVVADINTDEKYEDLREVYAALALAQLYKSKVTPRTDIFRDSLDSSSASILKSQTPWQPKDIWDKYVYSFKNGEYKCWENTTAKTAKGIRTKIRLHSAGGVEFGDIKDHFVKIVAMPPEVQNQTKKAITDGFVDNRNEVLFGYRLHVDQKRETQITGISPRSSIRSLESSQGINDPLKENRTANESSLTSKIALIQNNETLSNAKVGGNTSRITCPEGWMGPDENGDCWQMQIMS